MRLLDLTHLVALGVTLAVEGSLMALAAVALHRDRRFVGRATSIAVALNLVSHTLFWIGYPRLAAAGLGLTVAEALVTLAEAIVYWRACPLSFAHAWLVSVLLNGASFILGGALWALL